MDNDDFLETMKELKWQYQNLVEVVEKYVEAGNITKEEEQGLKDLAHRMELLRNEFIVF